MSKCGVFVRMVYDAPYMNAFLHHYLNLGFHRIFMLFNENFLEGKDIKVRVIPSHPPSLEKTKVLLIEQGYLDAKIAYDERIVFQLVPNKKNKLYNDYIEHIPPELDWVLICDSDEFLFLNKKFKNVSEMIESIPKPNAKVPPINVLQFKWGWIHNSFHEKEMPVSELVKKFPVYEYKKSMAKSMYRKINHWRQLRGIGVHSSDPKHPHYGIAYQNDKLQVPIGRGFNLPICDKTQGFLLHIRNRSFYNLILKSVNIHGVNNKNQSKDLLINYLGRTKDTNPMDVFNGFHKCKTMLYEESRYFHSNKFHGKPINNIIAKHFYNGPDDSKIIFAQANLEEKHLFTWMSRMLFKNEYFIVHRDKIFESIKKLSKIMESFDLTNIQSKTRLYPFLLHYKPVVNTNTNTKTDNKVLPDKTILKNSSSIKSPEKIPIQSQPSNHGGFSDVEKDVFRKFITTPPPLLVRNQALINEVKKILEKCV